MSENADHLAFGGDGGFTVDDLSTGPHAHGFGRTGDGRTYAFRVRRSTLFLEIYQPDLQTTVPDPADVVAAAERSVREVDLGDERSVIAAVRDSVAEAAAVGDQPREGLTVRAFLTRIGSVIDGM